MALDCVYGFIDKFKRASSWQVITWATITKPTYYKIKKKDRQEKLMHSKKNQNQIWYWLFSPLDVELYCKGEVFDTEEK